MVFFENVVVPIAGEVMANAGGIGEGVYFVSVTESIRVSMSIA